MLTWEPLWQQATWVEQTWLMGRMLKTIGFGQLSSDYPEEGQWKGIAYVESDIDGDASDRLLLDLVAARQLLVVTAFLGCLLRGGLAGALLEGGGNYGNREGDDSEDVLGKHVD
ncbi:MAG: hypothetical protein M1830_009519 [Pleopsidium flavum]|nr:MAG: hypothetical protein M1830_009519 [Pleopsidium flavum]